MHILDIGCLDGKKQDREIISESDIERLKEAGVMGVFGFRSEIETLAEKYKTFGLAIEHLEDDKLIEQRRKEIAVGLAYLDIKYKGLSNFRTEYVQSMIQGKILEVPESIRDILIDSFDLSSPNFVNKNYSKFLTKIYTRPVIIFDKNEVDNALSFLEPDEAKRIKVLNGLGGLKKKNQDYMSKELGLSNKTIYAYSGNDRFKFKRVALEHLKEYDEETTRKFIIAYFTYCDIFVETEEVEPDIRCKLTEVLEKGTIKQNSQITEYETIKSDLIKMGLYEDDIRAINTRNLIDAKKIVDGYEFVRKISDSERKALILAIITRQKSLLSKDYYLADVMKTLKEMGLSEQEVYGTMINLSLEKNVVQKDADDKNRYDFSFLLSLKRNREELKAHNYPIKTRVQEDTIKKATSQHLTEEELKETVPNNIKIIKELTDLGINEADIKDIKIKNLIDLKTVVDGYKFQRDVSDKEKKALILAMLEKTKTYLCRELYLSSIIDTLGEMGLSEQEVYGGIINLCINRNVVQKDKIDTRRYDISFLLTAPKSRQALKEHNYAIKTIVEEDTIKNASLKYLTKEELGEMQKGKKSNIQIINELKKFGFNENDLQGIKVKNLEDAKQFVDEYDFGREVSAEEKTALIYAILTKPKQYLGNCYLSSIKETLEEMGLSEQEANGAIINLCIDRNVIKKDKADKTRYDISFLLLQPRSREKLKKYNYPIRTLVEEEVIKKAVDNLPDRFRKREVEFSEMSEEELDSLIGEMEQKKQEKEKELGRLKKIQRLKELIQVNSELDNEILSLESMVNETERKIDE